MTDGNELWTNAPRPAARFSHDSVAALPEPARRYLLHALALGAPQAEAVRLSMHGAIRLKGRYHPFQASQVSVWGRGFRRDATAKVNGLPVKGYDSLDDGAGEMRWRLLGLLPVVHASGVDVTRSCWGRMIAEAVWLPAALLRSDVTWSADDKDHAAAHVSLAGESARLDLELAESGALRSLRMQRWGNPSGGPCRYHAFGGYVEAERTFDGVTIPTRLRIGWFMGSERFEPEGEFFRVDVDTAEFIR